MLPRHLRARPIAATERTLLVLNTRVASEHTEGLGVYSGYPDDQPRHSDKESRARE